MIKFTVVDAFTRTPFQGNQAAVCLLKNDLPQEKMQTVAAELNYSASAFLNPVATQKATYDIRWFTPATEVNLCGHATLAAAHSLWDDGHHGHGETLHFVTKEHGTIEVRKRDSYVCMDFPRFETKEASEVPESLKQMFTSGALYVGTSNNRLLVELESGEQVANFTPDFLKIKHLSSDGLIITAKSHLPQVDFVNRCFFPKAGVNEDAVTGSAYASLGPYWMDKLKTHHVMGEQMSSRSGRAHVEQAEGQRLILSGQAVSTFKGIFTLKF